MAAFIGALVTMNVSAMLAAVTIVIGALKESTTEGETSNAQNSSLYESSHFQNSSKTQDFTISDTEASLYGECLTVIYVLYFFFYLSKL